MTRLLDAAEVRLMAEGGPVVPCLLVVDLLTPFVIVKDSIVENRLDVGVIIFDNVLRQVQVKSVGESGVEDDEDGVPAAAQNKSSNENRRLYIYIEGGRCDRYREVDELSQRRSTA